MAEDEHLDVVPNFSLQSLHLLGGTVCCSQILFPDPWFETHAYVLTRTNSLPCTHTKQYGPFRPQMKTSVPMWLAMLLKKQGKCSVVPPRWLDVATLKQVIESERADDVFQGLPHHYIEIATDLCKHAREDLEDWNLTFDLVDTVSISQSPHSAD